jgi:putative transposase
MVMGVSERRVCLVASQYRSTQRRPARPNHYWNRLVARMREITVEHPRRGHRHIMDLLHKERWTIGTRLMKRLWRTDVLLEPQRRRKRRQITTGKNGMVRRRATRKDDVLGMDFVQDWTPEGWPLRMLEVLDE